MKGISHGCGVSYKSGKHKCAINNKSDTQTTSLFFCRVDDDEQVTVYGGGRSERRGMRVVVFTVMGPAQVLGGGASSAHYTLSQLLPTPTIVEGGGRTVQLVNCFQ